MDRVAIALGSNLGDRRAHLDYAVSRLKESFSNLRVSRYHETDPVGVPGDQPRFLNAAAVGETLMPAREILDLLLSIERERGRERPFHNAARTLDLDLILLGSLVVNEDGLTVPHPRFRERRFVLEPLAEIASELVDPVTGATIGTLLTTINAEPQIPQNRRLFLLPGAVKRDGAIEVWMREQPDDLGAIARRWFDVMRDCGDDVRELMHDRQPTACVGDAAFCYVDVFTAHVNVGFFQGADLVDPDQLLLGNGKYMRHVKLGPGRDIDAGALTRLIMSAYADVKVRLKADPADS